MLFPFFSSPSATVRFEVDLCGYTEELTKSLSSLTFDPDALSSVMDKYIPTDSIINPELKGKLEDAVLGMAVTANGIKDGITAVIGTFQSSCSRRRLGEAEAMQDGKQRGLEEEPSFDDMSTEINDLDNVQSVAAGFYPERKEFALDVSINVAQTLTQDDFRGAIDALFDLIGPAKDMFAAADAVLDIDGLLSALTMTAELELSIR